MDEIAKMLFWLLIGVLLCAVFILFVPNGM